MCNLPLITGLAFSLIYVFYTGIYSLRKVVNECTLHSKFTLMKTLVIFAVLLMATSGYSFTSAPEKSKDQSVSVSTSFQTNDFTYFRIHRQAKNVALGWGISSLDGVADFAIERSYDGEFFDVVNQMPCNGSLKQSWKDENVFPGYIYYRVTCVMADGSTHSTEVLSIHINSRG